MSTSYNFADGVCHKYQIIFILVVIPCGVIIYINILHAYIVCEYNTYEYIQYIINTRIMFMFIFFKQQYILFTVLQIFRQCII